MAGAEVVTLRPEEFVQPDCRLFIDTNVFMDTDKTREGGLKGLFERCADAVQADSNPIVVPGKVIDELTKQSAKSLDGLSEERARSIRKATNALVFLEGASVQGLVRNDLGDRSNPYADDLFVEVFRRAAHRYRMCVLTNDVTLRLRIRLLAGELDKELVAGVVTSEGLIEVDSDQVLFERGTRKLARLRRNVDEGRGGGKDEREIAVLGPLLDDFQQAFRVVRPAPATRRPSPTPRGASRVAGGFSASPSLQPPDHPLEGAVTLPAEGDALFVIGGGERDTRTLVLGAVLGEGGEGRVHAVAGNPSSVVKIFDAEHRTWHRRDKVGLLVSRDLRHPGIAFPTGVVTNRDGEFVGYVMPRAAGKELQATVMRPGRFLREHPSWTREDLVDVCISFLEKVSFLHSRNILLGDINPKNVMLDASKDVWIIDADSWQLEGYPCPVGTPMFTAPSVTGDYANALRTKQEELYAVATMLFMILITGQFPYARAGADGGDFAALIKEGKFTFQFQGPSDRDQPEGKWKYMWSHLPPSVKGMFWHTFHRDGRRYSRRPGAEEWLSVFREYKQFFGGLNDYDHMSHDVYPTRFRKMDAETPEYECATCGTSMVGQWNDEARAYRTPRLCGNCRRKQFTCTECGTVRSAQPLKAGRCSACNRKRDYTACVGCGEEVRNPHLVDGRCSTCLPAVCRQCRASTTKGALTQGRCAACHARGAQVDPGRLCVDCGKPFITFKHVDWFTDKGLNVPRSHSAIKETCPRRPTTGAQRPSGPAGTSTSTRRPTAGRSLWARLAQWWRS
ncbi:protein kinase domain-containing protein [Cellulomonas xiejunii]|uniref:protein kinase domain-containing protein n=1 Tax=Cellulomonas xiejunii TaxID=2968083 RepID=UPI001D0ED839|nr:hypothetical protein [Cellulomonas xiejunii]MCC2314079.1 hypothetical protein [Cellulomonas xiejunii]